MQSRIIMIGIFDSGVGGLTVVKELKKRLPGLPFLYLGDNARMPYGTRGEDIIRSYAKDDAEFLINQGATVIIIACNTASAHAGEFLRKQYPGIKFFEVISPAARAAAASSRGRIGVIGTRGTISSGAYEKQLRQSGHATEIFSQACPLFVSLVEHDWAGKPETAAIAKAYLSGLRESRIDTLILGCTHYPLLREVIHEAIGRDVDLIDPAEEVIKSLALYLESSYGNRKEEIMAGRERYFTTDIGSRFKEVAERWLDHQIDLEKAAL